MAKLGTFAASSTSEITANYLPQFLFFPDLTTRPTRLQVSLLSGKTILNLDGAGCDIFNYLNAKGEVANGYLFQVANGLIVNENITISMENAVAGTIDCYGFNPNGRGNAFAEYSRGTVLAGQTEPFENFAVLAVAAPTAADIFNVTMADGTSDKLSIEELEAFIPYFQNVNPVAAGLYINNTLQNYKKVEITPSTDRAIYKLRYTPVK